jgi:hypothetical protein
MFGVSEMEIDETRVRHCCQTCGELLEEHIHYSWVEVKACTKTMPALCPKCASWPGSARPPERTRGQENQ